MKSSQILLLCIAIAAGLLLAGELIIRKNGTTATVPGAPLAAADSPDQFAAAATPTPLAEAQLQSLLALNATQGHDLEIAPDVAMILGLTKDSTAVPIRQLSVVNGSVEAVSLAEFKDKRAGYVFAGRNETETYAFYADEKLNLIAAAKRSPSDTPAIPIPGPEAKQTFREVLSIWSRIADSPPPRKQTTGGS